jgi:spore germination protein GerM
VRGRAWLPLVLLATLLFPACRSESPDARAGEAAGEPPAGEAAPEPSPDDALTRLRVVLYYPSASGEGLVAETHEIFKTAAPGDLGKQIVSDLISGPLGPQALPALPTGTELRQLYIDDEVAYVDFSPELKTGIGGGSLEERLAVYAIVNSIALNLPGIRRVGILVEGRPVDTLNGHLDLTRPLRPDRKLIVGGDVV